MERFRARVARWRGLDNVTGRAMAGCGTGDPVWSALSRPGLSALSAGKDGA